MRTVIAMTCWALLLTGCGGGDSGSMTPAGWHSGVYQSQANFDAKCAMPRTGTDPITGVAYPDSAGSTLDENNWLRSWTNELYLWFNEVKDQDPSLFATTGDYFDVLKTTAATASGAPKDRFHFTYPTSDWEALALSGVQVGYGAQWVIIAKVPPRQIVVAYTETNSPAVAAPANLARGAEVLQVDGVDVVSDATQAGVDTINAGLVPRTADETHTFLIRDQNATQTVRVVTLVSANITTRPVQNVSVITPTSGPTGPVGYMLFNEQLASSQAALVSAFTQLQNAGVRDLVLDLRYNGGGYSAIASEVAYMIAGLVPTAGMTFELTQFNSKYPSVNPVTGRTIAPMPFLTMTQDIPPDIVGGQPLPSLNLLRVFMLTGPDTCSASEAIINGLRGIYFPVVQVGSTTCGKPYGFYPQDNCGTTYFSIEFQGFNAVNFGDYSDGFSPNDVVATSSVGLPGCTVADDFTHALGDQAEARLAAALYYRANNRCPAAVSLARSLVAQPLSAVDGRLPASPLRQLRILTH